MGLDQFNAKRSLWIECLLGEDPNSIASQMHRILWDTAVFRTAIAARELVPTSVHGGPQINGPIFNLLDRCFFESQAIAVRRLCDNSKQISDPKKGVYSMMSLLDDMSLHAGLVTRENIFAVEGLTYDVAPIKSALANWERQNTKPGISYSIPREFYTEKVEQRHYWVSLLSGVTGHAYSKNDAVRPTVFEILKKLVAEQAEIVETYVNKFIAHAATPESRQTESADELIVTWQHLWEFHRVVSQALNFIGIYILGKPQLFLLPVPQYYVLEHIDKPLVPADRLESMRDVWGKFEQEVNSWTIPGIEDIKRRIARH